LLRCRYSGSGFQFPFNIGKHQMILMQMGDRYDVLVDSKSFNQQWDYGKILGWY